MLPNPALNRTRGHMASARERRCRGPLTVYVGRLVTCGVTGYYYFVIRSFRHKGLEQFFLKGAKAGILAQHANRLRLILGRLQVSIEPGDMNLPGLVLHPLTGTRKGTWSIRGSGNWRSTFGFDGGDAVNYDYEDYH